MNVLVRFLTPDEGGRTVPLAVDRYAGMCIIDNQARAIWLRFVCTPDLGKHVQATATFAGSLPTKDFDLFEGKKIVARVMLVP